VDDAQAAMPHDVVLTHDGKLLFAYAADQEKISAARRALESARGGRGEPVKTDHFGRQQHHVSET